MTTEVCSRGLRTTQLDINLILRGFISIQYNDLNSVLAKILIKRKENSIELVVEMPVTSEKACVTLSMGANNFQS